MKFNPSFSSQKSEHFQNLTFSIKIIFFHFTVFFTFQKNFIWLLLSLEFNLVSQLFFKKIWFQVSLKNVFFFNYKHIFLFQRVNNYFLKNYNFQYMSNWMALYVKKINVYLFPEPSTSNCIRSTIRCSTRTT